MPAVSKAQQRFMGMVHAADKGETPASPEVAKVSADMKDSDAKDFASTKHAGLPDHVKEQLKSVVREVIREKSDMNEMSSNDVHFKHIMKLYDRGGSFTRKKIGAVVCKDPKASRKDVEEVLFDSDYRDIIEFEDELGLKEIREKYSSVKEDAAELPPATIPAAINAKLQLAIDKIKDSKLTNNAKLQLLARVIDAIGIDKSQLSTIASKIRSKMESVVTEEFKHVIHVDTPTQVVSKPIAAQIMALAKKGVRSNEIGLEMGFVGNQKVATDAFQKVKNQIYFALDKRNESLTEGSHGMATKLLQSIVSGDSSRAEGTKMSKELAQHYIDWIRTSPFGKKNGNLPLDMLVKASFNWGIERGLDSKLKGELSKLKSTIKESVNEVKYPTDLKVGSVILGRGFTMLKGIEGGKYYKVVSMDDTTATLTPSDKSGNTKGSKQVRHKLDSIEGGIKTAKRGDENGIVVIKESVNEEHDCGCNENHDCGCGGLHEHHINEDINADANGIAGLTASRANAVKDFIEKNNINSNKLYLSLKKGGLKDRMDFVTALVGKPGNPIQKKVIAQFSN